MSPHRRRHLHAVPARQHHLHRAPRLHLHHPLSGVSATSGSFTTAVVGTYHWIATYNGDANNTTVSSGCTAEPVTITGAPQPVVTKTVTSNTQNPNGTWTIVYDVAVTNADASIETSFTVDRRPGLRPQHRRQPGESHGKAPGASRQPSWNGTTDTTIVAGAARPRSHRALHRDRERLSARRRHRE